MTESQISMIVRKKFLLAFLSNSNLNKLGKGLEPILLDIMRQRTNAGFDIYGRKFGGYNRSYNKKYALSHLRETATEYKGTTATPLRLSGQLFSNMIVKYSGFNRVGTKFLLKFIFTVKESQLKKVEGLTSTTGTARNRKSYSKKSWMFLGLSLSGSRVQIESKVINDYFKRNSQLLLERIK